MKLEERVCSFELSKKLKKLGVPQDSYWSWWRDCCKAHENITETVYLGSEKENPNDIKIASAPTVGELGEKLGEHTNNIIQVDFHNWALYNPETNRRYPNYVQGEANARAQLLAYLISAGIIKVKKLKRGE